MDQVKLGRVGVGGSDEPNESTRFPQNRARTVRSLSNHSRGGAATEVEALVAVAWPSGAVTPWASWSGSCCFRRDWARPGWFQGRCLFLLSPQRMASMTRA